MDNENKWKVSVDLKYLFFVVLVFGGSYGYVLGLKNPILYIVGTAAMVFGMIGIKNTK